MQRASRVGDAECLTAKFAGIYKGNELTQQLLESLLVLYLFLQNMHVRLHQKVKLQQSLIIKIKTKQ